MLIFRVEHAETGQGPYNGPGWFEQADMASAHTWDEHLGETHPSPRQDDTLGGMARYVEQCACDSPDSLLTWFAGYWHAMADSGYRVAIIESPDARVGRFGQVVYPIDTATVADTLPIDVFLDLFAELQPA